VSSATSGSASTMGSGCIGDSCRAASSRLTTGLADLLSMQQKRHASRCSDPCGDQAPRHAVKNLTCGLLCV
jgi:hypothetical protein